MDEGATLKLSYERHQRSFQIDMFIVNLSRWQRSSAVEILSTENEWLRERWTEAIGLSLPPWKHVKLMTTLEATHKSAKTHAGSFFVTRDLDLCHFNPKINEFPRLVVGHCLSSLVILKLHRFWDRDRQTDRQTADRQTKTLHPTPATVSAWITTLWVKK